MNICGKATYFLYFSIKKRALWIQFPHTANCLLKKSHPLFNSVLLHRVGRFPHSLHSTSLLDAAEFQSTAKPIGWSTWGQWVVHLPCCFDWPQESILLGPCQAPFIHFANCKFTRSLISLFCIDLGLIAAILSPDCPPGNRLSYRPEHKATLHPGNTLVVRLA